MGFSNRSLKSDLITLWKIQGDLQKTASTTGIEAAEGYFRELLDKAQEFIARYGPEGFIMSLGGVAGSEVSFTRESKRKPVPRFLAEA